MEVDVRKHAPVREAVHAGISALRVQGRQIWGETRHSTSEIAIRLMVGIGDVARVARDGAGAQKDWATFDRELKKELGNILFSIVRFIDDLGFDALECIDLAVEAQEKFAKSGRPR